MNKPLLTTNPRGTKLTAGSVVKSNSFDKYTIGLVYSTNSTDDVYNVLYITSVKDKIKIMNLKKEQMTDTGLYVDLSAPELSNDTLNNRFLYDLIERLQTLKNDYSQDPPITTNPRENKLTAGDVVKSDLFGEYNVGLVYNTNSTDDVYDVLYITSVKDKIKIMNLKKEQMTDMDLSVDLNDQKLLDTTFLYGFIRRLQNLKYDYIEVDGGSRKTKRRKSKRRKSKRHKTNRNRRH